MYNRRDRWRECGPFSPLDDPRATPLARSTTRRLHHRYSPEVIISLFINPVQQLFGNQTGINSLSAHCHGPREDCSIRPGVRSDAWHMIADWLPGKSSLLSLSFRTCAGRKTKMPPNVNSVISRSRCQEERYCEHCSEDFIGSSPSAAIFYSKRGWTGMNNASAIFRMHNLFWVHCLCLSSLVSNPKCRLRDKDPL